MLTVVPISVNVSGAGDHILHEALPGQIVKVFRIVLTCETEIEGGVDVQFKSGSDMLPGPLHVYDGGTIVLGMERRRWVATEIGENLVLNLSGDATIKGALTIQVIE